jgi:hypothetical protein
MSTKKIFKKICKRFQSLFIPRLDCQRTVTPLYVYPSFAYVFSYITPLELAYDQVV